MATYTIEGEVFSLFPQFRRGVIIATGIDNSTKHPEIARFLAGAITAVPTTPSVDERAKIGVWDAAYTKFGSDPERYTPSIRFLLQQIRKGKPPRSISPLVDLFNAMSIRWTVPCGGDDLDAVEGADLLLGLASGDETFAPLFKPTAVEHPEPGEVIYYAPQIRRVLCRRWTWRNSDFSKLTLATSEVAINVDMMIPPFGEDDVHAAVHELGGLIQQYCGGSVSTWVLSPVSPSFVIPQ